MSTKPPVPSAPSARGPVLFGFAAIAILIGGFGLWSTMTQIAGAVVACMIFKVAYDILKHAVKGLMDSSPESEQLMKIWDVAAGVEGIAAVSDIKARYIGQRLFIDLEICVDPELSVDEGHTLAAFARSRIIDSVPDAYEVMVHVEPQRTVSIAPNTAVSR